MKEVLGLRTMNGLNVASDLINELRELLQMHRGTILGILHILNALQAAHAVTILNSRQEVGNGPPAQVQSLQRNRRLQECSIQHELC